VDHREWKWWLCLWKRYVGQTFPVLTLTVAEGRILKLVHTAMGHWKSYPKPLLFQSKGWIDTVWQVVIAQKQNPQPSHIKCNCPIIFLTVDHKPCSWIVIYWFLSEVIVFCNKKDSVCSMACKHNIRFLFPLLRPWSCSEPYHHLEKCKSYVHLSSSCNMQYVTRSWNTLEKPHPTSQMQPMPSLHRWRGCLRISIRGITWLTLHLSSLAILGSTWCSTMLVPVSLQEMFHSEGTCIKHCVVSISYML